VYDALILAGGSGRRLGGVDKAAVVVGELSMLDRVLLACTGAAQRVVVGPSHPTSLPVAWTREDPPGRGPVPAAEAGLALVTADLVLLLAVDLPFFTAECAELLISRAPAVIVAEGRPQWLCGAWPSAELLQAVRAAGGEQRLGVVLGSLAPAQVTWQGSGRPWEDCDTEQDLLRARSHSQL